MKAPIFIGGAGRSGTTLLRVMLNAHPRIYAGPEFKFIPQAMQLYQNLTSDFFSEVRTAYYLDKEEIQRQYRNLISGLLRPVLEKNQKERIAEKTPHNILVMKELGEIFPDAKFIHVIRDGRDVASSLIQMDWVDEHGNRSWMTQNVENATAYWTQIVISGMRACDDPNLSGRVFTLKYEELIEYPEVTLKKLFTFLNEPWDPQVLDYQNVDRSHEPHESSSDQVERQLYTKAKQRWRKDFSKADAQTFARVSGQLLFHLGYESDPNWVEAFFEQTAD